MKSEKKCNYNRNSEFEFQNLRLKIKDQPVNQPRLKSVINIQFLFVVFALTVFGVGSLIAQERYEKTFKEVFENKNYVQINHRNGPIEILPASDGKVTITAEISVKAQSPEDAQTVFNHFIIEADGLGDRSTVNTSFKTKKWQSNNGNIRIEFEDGQRVKDIKDLTIKMLVYLPKLKELKLANRYGDIKIDEGTYQDLMVNLYNGTLEVEDIEGEFDLVLKYGKAKVGDMINSNIELYDSKFFGGDGEKVSITSKYSEFEMGDIVNLDLDSYDDNYEMGDVDRLSIKDKYSEFDIKDFKDGRMDLYDAKMTLGDGSTLKLKSKYTKMTIGDLQNLDCEFSYDDKITIGTLAQFIASSKYTDFRIGQLKNKFILESYDDNLDIGWITGPLEEITFNGKYTDLNITLPDDSKYFLEANTQYGKFSYPEHKLEHTYYVDKNDKVEFKGKVKGSTESSPKIKIKSYDGKIVLN